MKTFLALFAVLALAGAVGAQTSRPLVPIEDMYVSDRETRCGDFFVLTKGKQGASIMFEYAIGGKNELKVVAVGDATLTADPAVTAPSVTAKLEETGSVISADFRVGTDAMGEVSKCFPPPAKITP